MAKAKIKSPLLDMLGIDYPIIQGGMGPFRTTSLAPAVSNAGGLGTVSMPHSSSPEEAAQIIIEHIHEVQRATDRNFAVNTPIGSQRYSVDSVFSTSDIVIDAVAREKEKDPDLRERLVAYITSGGDPSGHHQKIKDAGMKHFHMLASVRHAQKMEALGVDGIMASGYEMGGHTHLTDKTTHTFVLIPSVVQAVNIPIVASGGICDAATLAAALALGAVGVQMGTRFIATQECEFHELYKKAIIDAPEHSTMVIPSMLGPGRHLRTPYTSVILEAEEKVERGELSREVKTKMVADAQALAEGQGDYERGLFLGGMCCSRVNDLPTIKELIDSMIDGAAEIINKLHGDLSQ